jgi:hypothetical protein
MIWTVDGGSTGFFFNIAIVNNSPKSTVVITDFYLELPWNDPQFRVLDDPKDLVPPKDYYSIPGTSERYPRDMVINHRRYSKGKLEPGDTIEGYLLGYGYAPIPQDIKTGSPIPMKLSVFDGQCKRHSTTLEVMVLKLWEERWKEEHILKETV